LVAARADGVDLDRVLEVLEEVRPEDVAGVAERARGSIDHRIGVDAEVQRGRLERIEVRVDAHQLLLELSEVIREPQDPSGKLHRIKV
jgi:hypothetical protein